MKTKPWVCSVV